MSQNRGGLVAVLGFIEGFWGDLANLRPAKTVETKQSLI